MSAAFDLAREETVPRNQYLLLPAFPNGIIHCHEVAPALLAAHFGTGLAVLGFVLGALLATGAADFGTLAQQVLGMLRAAGNEAGRQGTDIGAVAVQLNTAVIIFTSSSCRQAVAQRSQAATHSLKV